MVYVTVVTASDEICGNLSVPQSGLSITFVYIHDCFRFTDPLQRMCFGNQLNRLLIVRICV